MEDISTELRVAFPVIMAMLLFLEQRDVARRFIVAVVEHYLAAIHLPKIQIIFSGGSTKKYLGGLAPHHLGGNHG